MARYHSPDNPNDYVTPSRFKRMSAAKRVAFMVHWFGGRFEDPAVETPYSSREGGYRYVHGGPYNASDELWNEFGGIAKEEDIEAAVAEIEADGTVEWAPGVEHPDQIAAREDAISEREHDHEPPSLEAIQQRLDSGIEPAFGSREELAQRQELLDEIRALRKELAPNVPRHGGIGHNQPPEGLDDSAPKIEELASELESLEVAVDRDEPDLPAALRSTSRLQALLGWVGNKVDVAVDAAAKKFGDTVGTAMGVWVVGGAAVLGPVVVEKVSKVVAMALTWMGGLTLPF